MAIHAQRGTKRTCQNEECGARFYDLMRSPIACPICQSAFVPPPVREIVLEAAPKRSRNAFHRPSIAPVAPSEVPEEAEKIELVAADEDDDAETKIESEESDAILELEDDADTPVVDPSLAEGEKG
jgi:uncharacterized protein (TIGR02300 family)